MSPARVILTTKRPKLNIMSPAVSPEELYATALKSKIETN
jgi:hypothetical protein